MKLGRRLCCPKFIPKHDNTKLLKNESICNIREVNWGLQEKPPIMAHACRAASSFALFWLLPVPRPFSIPFTWPSFFNQSINRWVSILTAASDRPCGKVRGTSWFCRPSDCIAPLRCDLVKHGKGYPIVVPSRRSVVIRWWRWRWRWLSGRGRSWLGIQENGVHHHFSVLWSCAWIDQLRHKVLNLG